MNSSHASSQHSQQNNLDVRIFLLKNQPLFSKLTPTALTELAKLFHEVAYKEDSFVVKRDEPVDSFFLIVSGKAEVIDKDKNVIAVLHSGETIGLSEKGFFSETGLRMADVIAKKDLLVWRIELEVFQKFVSLHPEIDLKHSARMTLYLNFIKQIDPFAELDFSKVMTLMDRIQEIEIPANQVIFKQNDFAEECYFLETGKIEITFEQEGKERTLAELIEPTVFGELALLTKSKRNATAVTKEKSNLLVLQKKDFLELLKKGNIEEEEIVKLLIDRERFQQEAHITLHSRRTAEGNEIAILRNQTQGNYLFVSSEALFVWNRLDGNHTLQDIALEFYKKYHQIAIDEIASLLIQFIQSGFIHAPREKYFLTHKTTFYEKTLSWVRRIMEAHVTFKHANESMTWLYKKFGFIFYKKISIVLMSLITILGFFSFIFFTAHASEILRQTNNSWILLVLQSPLLILIVPLHELAHALTTKFYGRQVRAFGMGWFWIGPMAFTDTSDMWLSERKPRLMVSFSGLFFNAILAGLFAMLVWWVSSTLGLFLWLFALTNYLAILANLNPLLELDGYYLLMDYFDKPNLRAHALTWLVEKKGWHKEYLPEITYWISCVIFIILTALMTFGVQYYILNPVLPEQIGSFDIYHLQWILPLVVIVLSSLSLYSLIKRQQRLLHKSF